MKNVSSALSYLFVDHITVANHKQPRYKSRYFENSALAHCGMHFRRRIHSAEQN